MLNATDLELRNSQDTDAFAIMDIPTDSEKNSCDKLHPDASISVRDNQLTYVEPSIITCTEPRTSFDEEVTSSSLHALLAEEEEKMEVLEQEA